MPRISAICAQKRIPNRLNIFIDGEFAFGVERIVGAWLCIGDEVDAEKAKSILHADEIEKAYIRALKFLNIRARSVHEVTKRLSDAGFSLEAVNKTVSRLQSAGLLSDVDFAKSWVDNRCTFRPRAKRALTFELKQKGIMEEEIQSAICDLDENQLAVHAASKVASRFTQLSFDEFRKKMFGYLMRRGFSYGTTAEAVQHSWQKLRAITENN